jgi:hypothetical protein
VHQHFAATRLQGEWFALVDDDLAAFEQIVRSAVAEIGRTHPLALQRRRAGRPALSAAERRAHERDRKRRQRARHAQPSTLEGRPA